MTERESNEKKDPGFTIIDRRHGREEAEAGAEPVSGERGPADAPPSETSESGGASTPLAPIDFSTFIVSLSTSALYHVGLVPDPETGKPAEPNLPMARQTIDTLEILQEKTRGNLEPEEARLLESLLYELRMRFVEANK